MARNSKVGAWIGGAVLNILAVLGAVCIVLVIAGLVFNVSIIMFKTGSMSPTIPAGSAALVREIPAQDMEVGDVVTVDRGEKVLPVTHRVIDIHSVDESTGAVTFEMKGDANEEKDPDPYTAEVVRTVMFSVPGIAPVLQQWRNPYLLGGITIAASLLVVWAFWPRRSDDAVDEESLEHSRSRAESLRTPARTPKHAIVTPVVAALILGGGTFGADQPNSLKAAATQVEASGSERASSEAHGDVLRMRAFGDEESMRSLSPGESAKWSVDVWADTPDPGEVELEIGSVTSAPLPTTIGNCSRCRVMSRRGSK
ncbi:signal peptidase I [Brevibacterium sp. CFH 10365]|uniref:signal peptidase I n=1 Tax=Brevibacterium sp. CFH 10365 TaxID=2585207 RepID=UPI0012663347|nr:signal peptidase I [Brevibacterium sp. CFH 10365]